MRALLATWKKRLGFPRNDAWMLAPVDPELFLLAYLDYSEAIDEGLDDSGKWPQESTLHLARALACAETRLAGIGVRHPKTSPYIMRLLALNQMLIEGGQEKFRFGGFIRAEDGIDAQHCGVKDSFIRALAVARMRFIDGDDVPRYDLTDLLQKAQGFESGREIAA